MSAPAPARPKLACRCNLLPATALLLALLLPAPSGPEAATRVKTAGYRVEILIDGRPITVYWHRGQAFVAGAQGKRYEIRIHNDGPRRVEAVVSVDGRDVIDGRPASVGRRGYLVDAYGAVTIDGFRTSAAEVAAFRFSPVSRSYAARMGDDANVGVIGVAFFPERAAPPPAVARRYWETGHGDADRARGGASASPPAAPAGKSAAGESAAAGPQADGRLAKRSESRPGLGTAFGERRTSFVEEVEFERQNPHAPSATVTLRYDDWNGLVAAGVVPPPPRVQEAKRREQADPFPADDRFAPPPPGWR